MCGPRRVENKIPNILVESVSQRRLATGVLRWRLRQRAATAARRWPGLAPEAWQARRVASRRCLAFLAAAFNDETAQLIAAEQERRRALARTRMTKHQWI